MTRLPRQLARLAAPDLKPAAEWSTLVLDPMMGMGQGMMVVMAMGLIGMRRPSNRVTNDVPHDHAAAAQTMGINGRTFDMQRVDITTKLGTSETWEIQSTAMAHPFHMHGVSFRILSNNGRPPRPKQSGWKDVVLVEELAECGSIILRPRTGPLCTIATSWSMKITA